ncbi:MAG: hydrogenase maturation nickel metallochaperone HypA [Planctomycetota bacterium]|nr:hydrogenase maturation nickel metallochaperone HypA [Planctomycetota bacterium]
MHEFSLLKDLLRKIDRVRAEQQAGKVVSVTVRLGALAHISASHFREHFDEAVRGTPLSGARLEVIESKDESDPRAQEILLESVEVEDA